MNAQQIAQMAAEFKAGYKAAPKPSSSAPRAKVISGSVSVGGMINGNRVSGLGKTWIETIRDQDTCVYGLEPGQDHRVTMQYAYFN